MGLFSANRKSKEHKRKDFDDMQDLPVPTPETRTVTVKLTRNSSLLFKNKKLMTQKEVDDVQKILGLKTEIENQALIKALENKDREIAALLKQVEEREKYSQQLNRHVRMMMKANSDLKNAIFESRAVVPDNQYDTMT